MTQIRYADISCEAGEGESILSALEKAGASIPNSCRSGLCHSCLVRVEEGTVPVAAQKTLSAAQKAQNLVLACQCYPEDSMTLTPTNASRRVSARLVEKSYLSKDVLRIRLATELSWYPGQYTTLWKNDEEGRCFSIASHPDRDGFMEFHIRKREGGVISEWLEQRLHTGEECMVSQPVGGCIYTPECQTQPLLLVAVGTGLSPVYGVLKEALGQGHTFPIYLYTAAGDPSGLYLQKELTELSYTFPQLYYYPVVRRRPRAGMLEGDVIDLIKARHSNLKDWRVFLCGNPQTVRKLQKTCFLNGASMGAIMADAFEAPATSDS